MLKILFSLQGAWLKQLTGFPCKTAKGFSTEEFYMVGLSVKNRDDLSWNLPSYETEKIPKQHPATRNKPKKNPDAEQCQLHFWHLPKAFLPSLQTLFQ